MFVFFFQAEDGIRDVAVTGVQTCALPISQLSLAIGKKGQNVRLASKLIGWNIDIKSEEEKRQEIEAQMAALTAPGTPLSELKGVGPKTIEKIEAHGISSIEKLADMTPEQLMEIPG